MRDIRVAKVTLNLGAGKDHAKLEKGVELFKILSGGLTPVKTVTHKRIAAWGLRPGLPIGCKLTIRGKQTTELIKRLLGAKDGLLDERQFDNCGNISFGIAEYIDIPKMEYMPEIGSLGFQVCITLQRPGTRVQTRRIRPARIGKNQQITKEEAMAYMQKNFNVKFDGDEE